MRDEEKKSIQGLDHSRKMFKVQGSKLKVQFTGE
jgi:hypothetical protein